MGWNDLNTFSKARIMQLAVNSGITDLRAIRDAYNSYEDGGEKKSLKEKVNSKIKDAAYKISTQEGVAGKGNASLIDIAKALLSKKDDAFVDDNKYAYIYGTGERYPEVKEPIQGFDYSNYLNQSGYKGVKDVYGIINPYKEYHLDPKYKPLLEELAKHKYHFYDNADELFADSSLRYRDDVANFIHTLGVDDKGNVMIHDSDVYDFNPSDYNYTRGLIKPITKLEAALMNKVGTPYIIRQENQPIYYDDTDEASDHIAYHLDRLTDEDIAKITGSGLLEASSLTDRKFKNGGKKKQPLVAPKRVRQNDSPTSEASTELEDQMNKWVYETIGKRGPNPNYIIPYLKDKEIKVRGVGRVPTNALDSLAKYANKTKLPLSEALGLAAQETAFGAQPYYNYDSKVDGETISSRALGNSSYFRNFGVIPAENLVRDFRYNKPDWKGEYIDSNIPPLQHAFEYYMKGDYNRGDPNHTKDVKAKGKALMTDPAIQKWMKESKFVKKQ